VRTPSVARLGRALTAGCLLVGVALVAGCSQVAAGAGTDPSPSPSQTRWPAAMAGGSCQLLDYDVITATIGMTFDVAASSQSGATYTCVLEQVGSSLPDLALSVTPTRATVSIFATTVAPKGSTALSGLGKQGYSAAVPAAGGTGPGVEVGWLSASQRLVVLRLATAGGTTAAQVAPLRPKMVALAKQIEAASS
jgi:hypothetical protein